MAHQPFSILHYPPIHMIMPMMSQELSSSGEIFWYVNLHVAVGLSKKFTKGLDILTI